MNQQIPEVILDPQMAMRQAMLEMELLDWGDLSFQPRLECYLRSVEETGALHKIGRVLLYRNVIRLLKNRLRVVRDVTADPAISSTDIPRPLFVIGLPRTGTTFLHRLLSRDPAARFIHLAEGVFPSPPPVSELWPSDTRVTWTRNLTATLNQLAPNLATVHALDPLGPEECSFLFEHSFADLFFELKTNVPAYSEWLIENEDDPRLYQEYRSLIQHLGYRWNAEHWVFKAPRHLMTLQSLLDVFPDACVVWTHRDPAKTIPSMCSLSRVYRQMFSHHVDEQELGSFWLQRLRSAVNRAMAVRENDHSSRYCDVHYEDLIADPIRTVRSIYESHGYEFTGEFEAALESSLRERRESDSSVRKRHRYSCEEFGLAPAIITKEFAEYYERFLTNDV